MKRFKKLSKNNKDRIVNEVKMMITAHRDCLWNRWMTTKNPLGTSNPCIVSVDAGDGYYGEAFGMMRALNALGYGYFGSCNLNAVEENRSNIPEHNLKWWFERLVKETLDEEGFPEGSPDAVTEMLEKYRKLVRK